MLKFSEQIYSFRHPHIHVNRENGQLNQEVAYYHNLGLKELNLRNEHFGALKTLS
jgi:hypothetical protein